MNSLAIAATHPIQYYAPIYRELARRAGLRFKVFYHHFPNAREQGEEFDVPFQWDIDLLSGYESAEGEMAIHELLDGMSSRSWTSVMVHGWYDSFSRRIIKHAWQTRTPIFVRSDSHLYTPRSVWRSLIKIPIYRYFLQRFSRCLAVGTWSAEYYRHYGVKPERIIFSPHCVDQENLKRAVAEQATRRTELREEWGIPKDAFVFLSVGKMITRKRIEDFILACAACQKELPQTHALLVGDGHLKNHLQEVARSHGVKASFVGFLNQSRIAQAYLAGDCFVLASEIETWGLVVNEALACNRPCIVSDLVGCAIDMIIPGITGLTYPCKDVKALSEAMKQVAGGSISFDPNHPGWRDLMQKHSCQAAADGIIKAVEESR